MSKKAVRPLNDYVAEVAERTGVRRGVPLPLGTHEDRGGVNFALFSRHASRVRLALFDLPGDATPTRAIDLDPGCNRTGDVWHVWVAGIRPGQLYAYRLDGPYRPEEGHRFNFDKLLLDPLLGSFSERRWAEWNGRYRDGAWVPIPTPTVACCCAIYSCLTFATTR